MKCPFCFNEMIFVEVDTDDCIRECLECINCGLRTPGVETGIKKSGRRLVEVYPEDTAMLIEWFENMYTNLQPLWNPEGE